MTGEHGVHASVLPSSTITQARRKTIAAAPDQAQGELRVTLECGQAWAQCKWLMSDMGGAHWLQELCDNLQVCRVLMEA